MRKRRRKPMAVPADAAGVRHVIRLGTVFQVECCDCGLVHREVYVPDPKDAQQIIVFSYRDEPATTRAHARRKS